MIAQKIHVYSPINATKTFVAQQGRFLKALVGRQGELRILQIEVHEDVDIETKKQLETVVVIRVFNRTQWEDYENGDLSIES